MAFNTAYDIKLMFLTHHAFLIVVVNLGWVCHTLLLHSTNACIYETKSHRMKPEFMKHSQNEAYWPTWVFKVAIFISLVQRAHQLIHQLNISLRKHRCVHFLTCQHSTERCCHWCMFQHPPTSTRYMLEAHVQKPALLEIKMSICKRTDGFSQVQRHILGRISGEGRTAGGGGLAEFEKASWVILIASHLAPTVQHWFKA